MNDWEASTDDVRHRFSAHQGVWDDADEARFDRWLAEVERAAAEKAWDECARAQLEYEQSVRREWPWNPYRKETR